MVWNVPVLKPLQFKLQLKVNKLILGVLIFHSMKFSNAKINDMADDVHF